MSFNQNLNQAGWFYHAPAKQKTREQVIPPPPSQIPLLSGENAAPPEEPSRRNWIKDTDSQYVVLAKQGGRPDLLRVRTPPPPSDGPRGYPRCEWYYLEDNAIEDAEKNSSQNQESKYEFMLPDYMVYHTDDSNKDHHPDHDKYVPSSGYAPRRAVFEHDGHSAFERDRNPTDKTQKIPEARQDGYGIRSGKLKNKPVKHTTPKPERGKAPEQEIEGKKRKPVFKPDSSDPTLMSKILSYGYQRDYEDQKSQWDKDHSTHKQEIPKQENVTSEYEEGYKPTPPSSKTRLPTKPQKSEKSETIADKKEAEKLEKELFKLSNKEKNRSTEHNILGQKFRNFPASDVVSDIQCNILGQPILPPIHPRTYKV